MRNIHLHIWQEYGQESVKELQIQEKIENKIADFKKNRWFLLRCLREDIIPVSIRLKSNVKTPTSLNILKKVKRALLNEKIRTINNVLEMLEHQRGTCINKLSRVLDQEAMEECKVFMNNTKEARHLKTIDYKKKAKFEMLWLKNKSGLSNNENQYMYHGSKNHTSKHTTRTTSATTSKWVKNMSSTPSQKTRNSCWPMGPNFTVSPKYPPTGQCITAIEQSCLCLAQGEAKELSSGVKAVMKKIYPPRPNITWGEQKAFKQLKEDNTRIVLTADKGVCMVMMDRE